MAKRNDDNQVPQVRAKSSAVMRLSAGALIGMAIVSVACAQAATGGSNTDKPVPEKRATPADIPDGATVGDQYYAPIAKWPNFLGSWRPTAKNFHLFTQDDAFIAQDPGGAGAGMDFGPVPGSWNPSIPYTSEAMADYKKQILANKRGEIIDPVGGCMRPHGMPREMASATGAMEIIFTPKEVRMTWDYFNATRRIYLDGRRHPTLDEASPSFMGHSVGRWEGNTLVIDTGNIIAGFYDQSGAPFSDQIHLVERIHLVGETLVNEMTITDPVYLTKPWVRTMRYRRARENLLSNFGTYCDGSSVDMSSGHQEIVLPAERSEKK